MSIRIGIIDYERPSKTVDFEKVRQILAVSGKDVIRIAWSSLNPNDYDYIEYSAVETWLCEFFNMTSYIGDGRKSIELLCDLKLLLKDGKKLKPTFDI